MLQEGVELLDQEDNQSADQENEEQVITPDPGPKADREV